MTPTDLETMTTKTDAARECVETVYYVAEERAFAPGIVKEWPEHIPHPTDPNGRLTKLKHFPPTQESETRSGCVPVSKLEEARYVDDYGNVCYEGKIIEALIAEISEKSEAKE